MYKSVDIFLPNFVLSDIIVCIHQRSMQGIENEFILDPSLKDQEIAVNCTVVVFEMRMICARLKLVTVSYTFFGHTRFPHPQLFLRACARAYDMTNVSYENCSRCFSIK